MNYVLSNFYGIHVYLLKALESVNASNLSKNVNEYVGILLSKLPQIEIALFKYGWYLTDLFFSPTHLMKQIGLIVTIQSSLILGNSVYNLVNYGLQFCTAKGRRLKCLNQEMAKARSYQEWKVLAEEEDLVNGFASWRNKNESSLYDYNVLAHRIDDLTSMMKKNKLFDMMFRLRGGLARDINGMQHEALYTRAKAGTKKIIERCNETAVQALNLICDGTDADEPIPIDAKLAFFNETRHAYGRTALMLSGSYLFSYYEFGI